MLRTISYWFVALFLIGSLSSCKDHSTKRESEPSDQKPEISADTVIVPFYEEDHPFSHKEFIALFPDITVPNWTFDEQDIYNHIDEHLDQSKFCNMLLNIIPYEPDFKEWVNNYAGDLGDEYGWAQIYPIGKMTNPEGTNLFFQMYTQTSASNGGFWDIWMVQYYEYHSVDYGYQGVKAKTIGSNGVYKFVESGSSEESGDETSDFEYFIDNYEYEKLHLERISSDSLQSTVERYVLRDGYDWRVDQNLNIYDSILLNDIITYHILY